MEELVYVLAVALSSGLALTVATWLWSHELDAAATVFTAMLSLYPLVGLFVVGEIVAPTRAVAVGFFALHMAIVVVLVPLWFLFAVLYTGRERLVTRRRLGAFLATLALLALVQLTDPIHGFLFEYRMTAEPFNHVATTPTALYPIFTLFQMVPFLLAMALVAYHGIVEAPAKRKQALALFVGFLPVLVVVPAAQAGVVPGPVDGATNIVSAWTLAFVSWAVFRYQLFDILSLARKRVFADLRDPIIVLDDAARVLQVNEAATEAFPVLADADGESIEDHLPAIRTDDDSFAAEFTYHGDRTREFAVSVSPLTTQYGTYGYGLVLRDVTSLNHQIRDLEQQSEQLERFASTLSHDLRNPLNVANARAELALETEDLCHLETTLDAHDRIDQIIEDTLTLAREGRTIDDPERVELRAVFEEAWASTATGTASHTIDPEANVVVSADATRLQNVFENLIRNAIEHGATADDAAGLTITLGRHADGFYVEDDGTGVPPDERERVFEYEHTTSGTGTGLGLAIVDAIARAHGWSVSMTAGEDGGTRVVFAGVNVVAQSPARIASDDA